MSTGFYRFGPATTAHLLAGAVRQSQRLGGRGLLEPIAVYVAQVHLTSENLLLFLLLLSLSLSLSLLFLLLLLLLYIEHELPNRMEQSTKGTWRTSVNMKSKIIV